MHATDIIGYTYNADNFCTGCIVALVATLLSPEQDIKFGDAVEALPHIASTEDELEILASIFDIDYTDERSYDSGDFPKTIFASQVEADEHCGHCHRSLLD